MQGSDSSRRRLVLEDSRAAQMMVNLEDAALLEQFWGQENTVSQVALHLGLKRNAVLYRVQRMLEVGLLEVTRQEPRRGRAITHYRLKAEEFFVPFEHTRFDTLVDFLRYSLEGWFKLQLEAEARNHFRRIPNGEWGILLGLNELRHKFTQVRARTELESVKMETEFVPKSEQRQTRTWATLNISERRARAILELFDDIYQSLTISEDAGEGTRSYLLQMSLIPTDPPDNSFAGNDTHNFRGGSEGGDS